ncbi:MAG TPA: hypothetical protein PKD15_00860 [Candidatus Saccharibacteria bacterium]|nr:hypothetical protein [Candidatus Saccharibacteria bacterium]
MATQQLSDEEKIKLAEEIIDTYLPRPHLYINDMLGCKTWAVQDEIVKSVFKNKYTAVKTCNAIGKSYIAARIVVTYLMLYPNSKVVTTAPTWRQVTDVLWREIGTAVKKSKIKLTSKEVTQAGLNLDTDWYAVGLSTKRPENFFGYHGDRILVVVDEAGGVEEPIFRGVAAISPNINARVLLIGNPTNPSGTFYDAFTKPQLGYNCITVSAFNSPNFTDSGITDLETLLRVFTPPENVEQAEWTNKVNAKLEKRLDKTFTGLISPSVVYSRYHEWGVDSPAWQSLVMGEFPSQASQALIPTNLITMAMNMYGIDKDTGKTYAELSGWEIPDGPPSYGQDMARFGGDLNVNFPRRGGWVDKPHIWNKKGEGKLDLMESADRILTIINPLDDNVTVSIDDTGNGGGTTDRLNQISREEMNSGRPAHRYTLVPYNFSSKEFMSDEDKERFHDITSLLYWNLRTQFLNKAIALHHDQQLFDELVGRRWFINKSGKIQVESKQDYKERTGGKSPDRSDALALSFAPRKHASWSNTTMQSEPSIKQRSIPNTYAPSLDTRY